MYIGRSGQSYERPGHAPAEVLHYHGRADTLTSTVYTTHTVVHMQHIHIYMQHIVYIIIVCIHFSIKPTRMYAYAFSLYTCSDNHTYVYNIPYYCMLYTYYTILTKPHSCIQYSYTVYYTIYFIAMY